MEYKYGAGKKKENLIESTIDTGKKRAEDL